MNYFESEQAAERYSRGRPYYHPLTIRKIREFLGPDYKFHKILDVACGTGLSTKALLELGGEIWAMDSSPEMLKRAYPSDKIHYLEGIAESIPIENQSMDLITVGSGIHWFNIEKFLSESHRILKNHGFLILYENYFLSEMNENPLFKNWISHRYKTRFPSPPRNTRYDYSNDNLNPQGFRFIEQLEYKNSIPFNLADLVLYLTTQSNIIGSIERGDIDLKDAEIWLEKELLPYFKNIQKPETFYFGNWIKFLKKIPENPKYEL